MVLQHKENFVVWDNLTEIGSDQATIVTDSDPLRINGTVTGGNKTAGVETTALASVFTSATKEIEVIHRVRQNGAANGLKTMMFISDGTTYIGVGLKFTTTGIQLGAVSYKDIDANLLLFTEENTDETAPRKWTNDEWTWFRMVVSGTSVTFFYVAGNLTVKPADGDWLSISALDFTLAGALGVTTKIGALTWNTSQTPVWRFDDLEIIQGAGIPIDNAVVDGENIKLSSVYVKRTLGQVGSTGRVTYHDPLRTLGPTVETAHRTVTAIAETRFNTTQIQGEIIHTDTMIKEIMVNGVEAKIGRTIANYNPVFMEGVVEYIDGNIMYKQPIGYEVSPIFSSFGSLADKLVVFIKKRQKEYRCGLSSVAYTDASDTPDTPT